MINPLQIEYFSAVAYYGSFTRTASELHVSQPAISKQIKTMEEELGIDLLDRSGKKVILTPGGQAYYDFFRRTMTEYDNLKKLASQLNNQEAAEHLHIKLIFFIDWDSELFISPMVDRLRQSFPQLTIDLENRGIYDIAASLVDRECDATICFDHLVPEQGRELLDSCHLADVHRMVYFSSRHPLAMKEKLSILDFKDEDCVAVRSSKHPEPQRTILSICARYGFTPKFTFKPNHDSVIMAVQSGHGYCILDEWSRNRWSSRFYTIPLVVTRPVSIYWRRDNHNPVIPVVVNILSEIMGSL